MATKNNAPTLTDGCWDCECEHDYIHAKIRETECSKCGAKADDQPDSHVEEVLADKSLRMTGSEYVERVGLCPFCHSDDIEGGTDTNFEGEVMISSCSCKTCGSWWKENYALDGWLEDGGDDADTWHPDTRQDDKIKALEEERDRLRAALQKIATMVKPGDIDAELSDEMGEPTEVEDWTIDEAYTTGTTCIELARAALGEE